MMHGSGVNVLNPCYFYIGIEYPTLLIGFRSELAVWTRTDSRNRSYEGIVTHIDDSTFTVESFLNPNYHTVHNLDSGRISCDYETSLDIVEVQA